MRHFWKFALGPLLAGLMLLLAACGSATGTGPGYGTGASTSTSTSTTGTSTSGTSTSGTSTSGTSTSGTSTGGSGMVVQTATASVSGASETVLTDTHGMTLYYFDPDTATTAACTGGCTQVWPPLLLPAGTPHASASLSGTLATVQDANGRQVTYNGHPLYTFSGDTKPGDTNGNGIQGKWHVATPSIPVLAANSSSSGTGSSGGYSYP